MGIKRTHRKHRAASTAIALAVVACAAPAHATWTWHFTGADVVGGVGWWNDGNNWTNQNGGNGVPGGGSYTYIDRSVATQVSFRGADPILGALHISDGTKFSQAQDTFTTQNEYISNGSLELRQIFGGGAGPSVHQVGSAAGDGDLEIAGTNASGYLSAGATLTVYGTESIGDDVGAGSFNHDSGAQTITGTAATLSVGWDGNAMGFYTLGNGMGNATLTAGTEIIGNGTAAGGGHGYFTQNGATNTVTNL